MIAKSFVLHAAVFYTPHPTPHTPTTDLEGESQNSKMHIASQILLWGTAPLILLLRMMFQEQRWSYGWSGIYEYYALQDGMKFALMLLSFFMVGTSLYLDRKSGRRTSKKVLTVVECIVILLICTCIIISKM